LELRVAAPLSLEEERRKGEGLGVRVCEAVRSDLHPQPFLLNSHQEEGASVCMGEILASLGGRGLELMRLGVRVCEVARVGELRGLSLYPLNGETYPGGIP